MKGSASDLRQGARDAHRRDACATRPLPSTANLILIGTVHGDPKGYERAWRLLGYFQPEVVTVEISRFSLRYRMRRERKWQRQLTRALQELPPSSRAHPAVERLAAQTALPFEVRAARDWSRGCGSTWRPMDLGSLARRHLPRYESELLSPGNLRALAETTAVPVDDYVAREFARARLAWQRSPWRLETGEGSEAVRRERLMARRLRRLADGGRRLVHLGGWEHLVTWQDGSGLANFLADLEPVRLLLEDADGLPAGEISC